MFTVVSMVELLVPGVVTARQLRRQIIPVSGFEDVPHIFPGTVDSRLAGLYFGFADASLLVPLFDFGRFKRETTILLRLLLCFTSA